MLSRHEQQLKKNLHLKEKQVSRINHIKEPQQNGGFFFCIDLIVKILYKYNMGKIMKGIHG